MVSMSYDLTDNLRGFFDASFANVLGINIQEAAAGFGSDQVNNCITPDNAYLVGNPELTAAVAARFGNGGFFACTNPFTFAPVATVVRKDFTQEIGQIVNTDSDTTRWVLGLEGDIGESTWSWDAYYQYGKTDREQIGYDYRSSQRILFAVDAVTGPNGQPMCRITRDNLLPAQIGGGPPNATQATLAQGCQPLNVFGANSMSPAARAYAFGPIVEFNHIDQEIIAGTVSGELWQGLGAGALTSAFGAEYRKEELRNDVNSDLPDPTRIDIVAQYGDAFGGEVEATEAFVEFELPLLANKPGAQLWSINAAYRDARYKTTDLVRSGGTSTQDIESYKFSSVWDPTAWLRIRGSRSHDVRAAGFRELYWSLTQPAGPDIFGQVTNPWRPVAFPGDQRLDPRTLHIWGNVALRPEEADTTTLGFVLTPERFDNRFRFSADYYEIEIENGIQGGNEMRVIANCYNIGVDCQYISGNNPALSPNGFQGYLDFTDTFALSYNARSYSASGARFVRRLHDSAVGWQPHAATNQHARHRHDRDDSADDAGQPRHGPRHLRPDGRRHGLLLGLGRRAGLGAQPRVQLCARPVHVHGAGQVYHRGNHRQANAEDRSDGTGLQPRVNRQHDREPHDESFHVELERLVQLRPRQLDDGGLCEHRERAGRRPTIL